VSFRLFRYWNKSRQVRSEILPLYYDLWSFWQHFFLQTNIISSLEILCHDLGASSQDQKSAKRGIWKHNTMVPRSRSIVARFCN